MRVGDDDDDGGGGGRRGVGGPRTLPARRPTVATG